MNKLFLFLISFFLITSAHSAGLDANTNLLLHMDGANDGTTFSDSSTENNKGDATVTATVQTKTATKKWGTASALFDGDSGYLTYADHADWDVIGSNSDNWTIDMQVKHTDHTGFEVYISQSTNVNTVWYLAHLDPNGFNFEVQESGVTTLETGWAGQIDDTNWHHVALIKVANEYGIYLDGTQISYTQDSTTATFTGGLDIGTRWATAGYMFDGNIDEVRIQHSNIFNASPNATPDDTITVPTEAYGVDVASQVIIIPMM